jgi:hypothetical protein
VALTPASVRGRLAETVVGQPGFELSFAESEGEAMQLLLRRPPDVFVLYDTGAGLGFGFLDRLLKAFPRPPFPVVLLAEFPSDDYPPAVKAVLPVDFEGWLFDRTVAELVGLPTVAGGRLLVRLGANLAQGNATSVLATACDLRAEGMVLAPGRALTVGAVYQVAVLGLGRGETALPPVRILREEGSAGGEKRLRRYLAGFVDPSQPVVERLLTGLRP